MLTATISVDSVTNLMLKNGKNGVLCLITLKMIKNHKKTINFKV